MTTWKWIKPEPLVDTNWADHDGDGDDDYPDSMLDFIFVAGAAGSNRGAVAAAPTESTATETT